MKKTLIYIASSPRSGSTIISNLLGIHPGIFNVGELCQMHSYLNEGRIGKYFKGICPCGDPVLACAVWGSVIEKALVRCDVSRKEFFTRLQDKNAGPKISRFMAIKEQAAVLKKISKESDESAQIARHCFALLDEIVSTQGVSVVVDSSKNCSNLAIYLAHKPDDWEIKVVHILRDPRATAVSMIKGNRKAGMPVHSFYRCSLGWVRVNRLIDELVKPLKYGSSLTIQLEAFCANPVKIVAELGSLIGLSLDIDELTEHPKCRHDIAGSRSVSSQIKEIDIRLDEQWKDQMNYTREVFSVVFTSRTYRELSANKSM